ncbi:MAG: hypothetical protein HYX28_06505 [Candidatus Koribacter versatilis]|uniref:Uncharacterized protein n=1 Tax=Candidatus Korobacter versatilis TaxID=658062 RepID=A0A932AA35_9BACT|nr:hypothetical protein [Candidatus Koribacter versatilis]
MKSGTGVSLVHKGIALALVLSLLTACQVQSVSGNVTVTPGGGISVSGTITMKVDPTGSEVAAFDTTQALVQLSSSNATLTSTSGTANIHVTDHATGQLFDLPPENWST